MNYYPLVFATRVHEANMVLVALIVLFSRAKAQHFCLLACLLVLQLFVSVMLLTRNVSKFPQMSMHGVGAGGKQSPKTRSCNVQILFSFFSMFLLLFNELSRRLFSGNLTCLIFRYYCAVISDALQGTFL